MGIFGKRKDKKNVAGAKETEFLQTQKELFKTYEQHKDGGFSIYSEGNATTLFSNDELIVCIENPGMTPTYQVVTTNGNGEKKLTVYSLEARVNIEMRSKDLYLLEFNGKYTNEYRVDEADYFYNGDELKKLEEKLVRIYNFKNIKKEYETSKTFFANIINGVKEGIIPVQIQAKCVCVDARAVDPEEVGKQHTVWSHGKVEKVLELKPDTVLITTLDANGNPIIDENGNTNTYDMSISKFQKKYKKHSNGHYIQDQKPMATIKLDEGVIPEEGITILPPNWGGYSGTLMKGGLIMLPFDSTLSRQEQIERWESYLTGEPIDWYPNNEADTYAVCDRNGKFKDKALRELFGQDKGREQ